MRARAGKYRSYITARDPTSLWRLREKLYIDILLDAADVVGGNAVQASKDVSRDDELLSMGERRESL